MNKNILIIFLLIVIGVLGYFQFKPKNTINSLEEPIVLNSTKVPDKLISNTNSIETSATPPLSTYNYGDTPIKYDSNKWKLTENRYCTPAEEDRLTTGQQCPVIGLSFNLKTGGTPDDYINIGGRQTPQCSEIKNATKCSDAYSMMTPSNNKDVLNFFDYLMSFMP